MRKEQRKVLQEKQKINLEKQPTDSVSDISTLNKLEKKALDNSNEPDVASGGSISSIESGKSALPSQTTTVRPLVPPGFTNMAQEKNSGPKSLVHSQSAEVQFYLSFSVFVYLILMNLYNLKASKVTCLHFISWFPVNWAFSLSFLNV